MNFVLGIWVVMSPWLIAHVMTSRTTAAGVVDTAMWDHYVVGLAVVAVTAIALFYMYAIWEEWLIIALGVWLLISPPIFGFEAATVLMWNAMIIGALVVLLAGWALADEQKLQRR
ncbi:SPW repeat protein [Burkholderia thailandensis]|uniref:SPW repeat protein n=1 Tax=Burkholderia thailandensis TaxID=57975 RepID=UPI001EE246A0|nr:SPW repeat protein [Burkholderia thailandensis]